MAETQEKYLQTLDDLEHITGVAWTLSLETTNRKVDSWREQYCSYIFAKLCLHAQAVLYLAPELDSQDPYLSVTWDISSLATIVRAVVDTYYVFFYLAVDNVSDSEIEFRYHLWNYHAEKQRLDLLKKIKSENPVISELKSNVSEFKNRLISSGFYKSIDLRKQQKLRKGDIGILYTNSELSRKAAIDPNYYKAIFNYLSQYVHAYPYALTQLMKFRAGDDESLMILKTVLDNCTGYICHAVRDFLIIMPDQKVNVDERAKSLMVTWEDIFRNENKN